MDQHLAHHGIKGMRWGVRRTDAQLGNKSSIFSRFGSSNKTTPSKQVTAKPKEKKVSEMTDEELRIKLNRLNMEKQYKQYMAEMNPKKQSRFKKVAGDILESSIKTLAAKAMESAATNLLKASKPEEPSVNELLKKKNRSTGEMQKLNAYFAAKKTLEATLSEMDKKPPSPKTVENGKKVVEELMKQSEGQLSFFDYWPGNPDT